MQLLWNHQNITFCFSDSPAYSGSLIHCLCQLTNDVSLLLTFSLKTNQRRIVSITILQHELEARLFLRLVRSRVQKMNQAWTQLVDHSLVHELCIASSFSCISCWLWRSLTGLIFGLTTACFLCYLCSSPLQPKQTTPFEWRRKTCCSTRFGLNRALQYLWKCIIHLLNCAMSGLQWEKRFMLNNDDICSNYSTILP